MTAAFPSLFEGGRINVTVNTARQIRFKSLK
jgi:hypothetical protein